MGIVSIILSLVLSPGGAAELSPQRELWEPADGHATIEPRRGGRDLIRVRPPSPLRGWVGSDARLFPWLTPWAKLSRPSGAPLTNSYSIFGSVGRVKFDSNVTRLPPAQTSPVSMRMASGSPSGQAR